MLIVGAKRPRGQPGTVAKALVGLAAKIASGMAAVDWMSTFQRGRCCGRSEKGRKWDWKFIWAVAISPRDGVVGSWPQHLAACSAQLADGASMSSRLACFASASRHSSSPGPPHGTKADLGPLDPPSWRCAIAISVCLGQLQPI